MTAYELHTGATFRPPVVDKWQPPPGEVTWIDEDITSVSTAGPALTVSLDFRQPRARDREQIVVVRLRDVRGYFPTTYPEYTDPDENLAVSATVRVGANGLAENVVVVIPYITMPRDSGGITEIEIAVHEPGTGVVTALDFHQIDLPEDFDRTPDLLTVIVHTLVALAQADRPLDRDAVRVIRTLVKSNFRLDELGDAALRRILKVAAAAHHSPQTLSEVVLYVVPVEGRPRLVTLMYAAAEAEGRTMTPAQQRFAEELLRLCEIHDHRRHGPAHLIDAYRELDLEPGGTLDEVRKAWRQLVRDYHPDRVQHLAQGFRDFAHQKTAKLNVAYKRLRAVLDKADTAVDVELDE